MKANKNSAACRLMGVAQSVLLVALAGCADGDTLTTQLAVLRRFAKHAPVNTIAIRRRVADAVLAQDKYPFEGR